MYYYCPTCGHHHGERCTATKHDPVTEGASKCGCTREQQEAA